MQPSNKEPRETLETLGDHSPRICTQWGLMAFMPPKGSGKTALQRSSVSDSTGLSPSGPTPTPTHHGLSSLVNTRGEWEQFRIFPFKFIANCLKCYSVKKERLNGPESLSIPETIIPRDHRPAVLGPFRGFKPSTKGPGWAWYLLLRKSPVYKLLLKVNVFSCEIRDRW